MRKEAEDRIRSASLELHALKERNKILEGKLSDMGVTVNEIAFKPRTTSLSTGMKTEWDAILVPTV